MSSDRRKFHLVWTVFPGATAAEIKGKQFDEAVEAVDEAEEFLSNSATKPGGKVEIFLNHDTQPHTIVYLTHERKFGLWNSRDAPWPVWYVDADEGVTIRSALDFEGSFPEYGKSENKKDEKGESDEKRDGEKGEEKRDDDSDEMKIKEPPPADHYDDDSDEDDTEGDSEPESASDEQEGQDEGTEPPEEPEPTEDGTDPHAGEGDNDDETEDERKPRRMLWARFKTPKGWRKRADSDLALEENRFQFQVGEYDDQGQIKKETLVRASFQESDEHREFGVLTIVVPPGVEFRQSKKGGTYSAVVPYDEG